MNKIVIFLLLFASCSASKSLHQVARKEKLSVSFFSIGSGIDYKKKVELDRFILDFQKSENVSLNIEKYKWGKEGEEDYCIDLKQISKDRQSLFVEKVRQLSASSNLIKINEVDSCKK